MHVIVLVTVFSRTVGFLVSLPSYWYFSSSVTSVSVPLASTFVTVIVNVFGGVGAMRAIVWSAASGAATFAYVHEFPRTSGRTFAPQAGGVGLPAPFFGAASACGTRPRASASAAGTAGVKRMRTLVIRHVRPEVKRYDMAE